MATFGVSIVDLDGDYAVSSDGTKITIIDYSNYDTATDDGHEQADFSDYKKIIFYNPDGTTYTFSSLGDGDAVVGAPADASSLPITTLYTPETEDGTYQGKLIAVPTWNNTATYSSISSNTVYYDSKLWLCVANNVGITPGTDITKWTETTESALVSKYSMTYDFAVYCAIKKCQYDSTYNAVCGLSSLQCTTSICKDEYFVKAMKLDMIINNIERLIEDGDYTRIQYLIELGTQICCCNE